MSEVYFPQWRFSGPAATRKGWHQGEKAIHERLEFAEAVADYYLKIPDALPNHFCEFFVSAIPFIPVTTLDEKGRPWVSIFAGTSGKPDFVECPTFRSLILKVGVWKGDPFLENFSKNPGKKMLYAGIGVAYSDRLRRKFAGSIEKIENKGDHFEMELAVAQAQPNCPKYVTIRELIPHPNTSPNVLYSNRDFGPNDHLPEEFIKFIHSADTVFVGSHYVALPEEEQDLPSHCGCNQRGGRPGFVRVSPTDKKTIVFPDYSGNRMMCSLGNIEATKVASFTFLDWVTGNVLYLTGTANIVTGPEATKIMPGVRFNALTVFNTTGCIFVQDAMPCRQKPGSIPQRSPYSPPVSFLAEEKVLSVPEGKLSAVLKSIEIHSEDVASFTWETASERIHIKPGQAIVLDLVEMMGKIQYQHMAAHKPSEVNDDRIRTWTVSSAHLSPKGTTSFTITARQVPNGAVTSVLFAMARKVPPGKLHDVTDLGVEVKVVGVTGDFLLPRGWETEPKKMLWIAGGIGVTPFISFLSAISYTPSSTPWEIMLVLAAKDPQVILSIISRVLNGPYVQQIKLDIHVFSRGEPIPALDFRSAQGSFVVHQGRLSQSFFEEITLTTPPIEREMYLCGTELFEGAAMEALLKVGAQSNLVHRVEFYH